MGVVIKIALRNLLEHKRKTLIIGIIIALMIMVLAIGNSMLDTATAGVRKMYSDNFTGDIVLTGEPEGAITLFGRMDMTAMDKPTPQLPSYFTLLEYFESHPAVEAVSPQISGVASLQFEDEIQGFSLLFGVDIERYQAFFPGNIELISGNWLAPGEAGIMLSERVAGMITKNSGKEIQSGDKVILTSLRNRMGTNIRELEVRGIFRFRQSNNQLDMVSLVDVNNLRSLVGMTRGAELVKELSQADKEFLEELDSAAFFDDDEELFGADSGDMMIEKIDMAGSVQTESDLLGILGDTSRRDQLAQTDPSAWHFLLVKLKNPSALPGFLKEARQYLQENDIPVALRNWREAAGMMAELTYTIKFVFNFIIIIIAVVAILIIMNTIVISVLERIPEIGTMRAIGAQKHFVRRMITTETVLISGLFGIIGLVLGGVVILVLNIVGIPAGNGFFEIIFGGSVLKPILNPDSVILTLIIALAAGFIASIYPVHIALGIQPVKAIQAD